MTTTAAIATRRQAELDEAGRLTADEQREIAEARARRDEAERDLGRAAAQHVDLERSPKADPADLRKALETRTYAYERASAANIALGETNGRIQRARTSRRSEVKRRHDEERAAVHVTVQRERESSLAKRLAGLR